MVSPDKTDIDFSTYQSPFSWRYGSPKMRQIWSVKQERLAWRQIWVELARAQMNTGLVTAEEVADLEAQMGNIDIQRALEYEKQFGHDLVAEARVFADQAPVGGRIIGLGATSMDMKDTGDMMRIRSAVGIIADRSLTLLDRYAGRIEENADKVCIGWTHLQPAEPTTVGYRFANYAQDLLIGVTGLGQLDDLLKGKGIKGAVGSQASFEHLLQGTGISAEEMEAKIMRQLGLEAFYISTQIYPRLVDFLLCDRIVAVITGPVRFANDLTFLQSPAIGEMSEPFGKAQIGSFAMPYKRNPVNNENIVSLSRVVASLTHGFSEIARELHIERRLTDSAFRRVALPILFLVTDEILTRSIRVMEGLNIYDGAIERNLETWGPFAATERLEVELVKRGADRLETHILLRDLSMKAWAAVMRGDTNPLIRLIMQEQQINQHLSPEEITILANPREYVGNAPEKARRFAGQLREFIQSAGLAT